MYKVILGILACLGVTITLAGTVERTSAAGLPRGPSAPVVPAVEAGLIALPFTGSDGASMVTVVDGRQRVMAVYRVDPANGRIKLLSVRNLVYDLQMMHLNGENPLPQEIRSLLEQK